MKGVIVMKKVIAAVMALCIVGGTIPSARQYAPESIITASAADDEMTIVDGKLTSMPNKPNMIGAYMMLVGALAK